MQLFDLRQIAREYRFAQRLDRLGPREALAPGEADAARGRRAREWQDADEIARAAVAIDRGRRQDGDADAACDHLPDGFERAALDRARQRIAVARAQRVAELEHLVAKAVALAEEQQAFLGQLFGGDALSALPGMAFRNCHQ